MSAEDANATLTKYRKDRKAFTDSQRAKRIQEGDVVNVHPYTGVQSTILRTMAEVEAARLELEHSFHDKDVLLLRISEEANLRRIEIRTARSDAINLRRTGDNFNVAAVYSELKGWVVTVCEIDNRKEVESDNEVVIITKPWSPFNYKMIAALIESTISTTPDANNTALRAILSLYRKEYAMTDNLIQQARTYAKNRIYGDAKHNVGFAKILARILKDMGHVVQLDMCDRESTMKRLTKVVLDVEKKRLKDEDGINTFPAKERI
jgi:hypothetical protein